MAIKLPVLDKNGQGVGEQELPSSIFERPVNVGLMHQAYVRQMANARLGTHATKTRGQVDRSKAKWYRQKGTGRARHGSRNAPIFVGGGVAHGPQPRSYRKDMPKKMRQEAIRSALSAKAANDGIVLVDKLELDAPKTRDMADILYNLVGDASALVLLAENNENVQRSIRNLPDARYLRANYLNIRDLLKYDKVIIPLNALEVITEWLDNSRSE
ncbi:MAG TPA: 50S ribosomal protein L4 [Aggregatilineales bacterium]|nr:50S ribosomal protein L4 [Aggregatilineales bacterium]